MTLENPPLPITLIYSKSFLHISLVVESLISIEGILLNKFMNYLQNEPLEILGPPTPPMIYEI